MFNMKQRVPDHLILGCKGEEIIQKYLKRDGFRILETNYLKKSGEIDIIAEKDSVLHFVEVKTLKVDVPRQTSEFSLPELHFNKEKRLRQGRVIQEYLESKHIKEDQDWQIDLHCLVLDKNFEIVNHEIFADLVLN